MSTSDQTTEQTPKPQITKEELELKKLTLEIKDLERPFLKRPTYILSALPTLLATIGLLYGFANGYFSVTSERLKADTIKLENQKRDLQAESTTLEKQKNELQGEVNKFEKDKAQLILDNERLREEEKLLIAEKDLLETKIAEIQKGYEAQLATLIAKRTELERNNGSLSQKNGNLLQAIKEQEAKAAKMVSTLTKEKEALQAQLPKPPPPETCWH